MVEYLTQEQLTRLRSIAKAPRDRLLIDVLYHTGCTVSELVNAKVQDLARDTIDIHGRVCVIGEDLAAALKRYAQTHESAYLFPSRQRDQLTEKRIQQIIKGYLEALELPVDKKTPHLLRYTHIAHAIKQHIPLSAIREQTGLGDLRLSQIASDIEPADTAAYGRMFT